jgi:hypothetical protein
MMKIGIVVAALLTACTGTAGAVTDRGCYLLTLTANMLEEFGGGGITGSDVVRIQLSQAGSP